MPVVFVPSLMQKLCNGEQKLVIEGTNLRQVIDNLDLQYTGFKDRLVENGKIKPNISDRVIQYMIRFPEYIFLFFLKRNNDR